MKDAKQNTYDEFPYTSYPFQDNAPEHIRSVGILFGMNPPALDNARILELGCSSGNNIIRFAANYPNSYSLGIDLSAIEIEHGSKMINELGFNNIELKNLSITDIDESFGKFDYIICHGVFSWVNETVRNKILEISNKLLNKNGISLISYNVLPGWNMVNSIRDMMLFHASHFTTVTDKVLQAKLFFDFVNESLENNTSSYAKFLAAEASMLKRHEDCYLRHEYLGDENQGFYFHDFIDMAKKHNLQYLGDTKVQTMFIGNLQNNNATKVLSSINDIVRSEQYMDFIMNRRFRTTLLCQQTNKLNRSITPELLDKFYLIPQFTADKPEDEASLSDPLVTTQFNIIAANAHDANFTTSSPVLKAIFYAAIDNCVNPLTMNQLAQIANTKLPQFSQAEFKHELTKVIGQLILAGYYIFYDTKPKHFAKISNKPLVTDLVRYQAKNADVNKIWVTNQLNALVGLQLYDKYVIELLDGKHEIVEIEQEIFNKLLSGVFVAQQDNTKITKTDELKDVASRIVQLSLTKLKQHFILIG